MAKNEDKVLLGRLVHSYISSILSITLVLLLVAIASTLQLNTSRFSRYFKENIKVSVLLKGHCSDAAIREFEEELSGYQYVKNTRFISAEEGLEETRKAYGDIFVEEFQIPPVPDAIEIGLHAEYVNSDSLRIIAKEIQMNKIVDEVAYKEALIDIVNANTERASMLIYAFVIILAFISIYLISNTVRLNVFANRFNIHTMKLVGATKGFIKRPFIIQSVFQGLISAILTMLILLGLLFYVKRDMSGLVNFFDETLFAEVAAIVTAFGVVLCWISTSVTVGKLLNLRKDELL